MRLLPIATGLCLTATASLAAPPVVTENVAAVIAGSKTVDTMGYFGTPGADLSGADMAIYVQYVPSLLGASQACRTHACTYNVSTQMPDTPGSVLVTLTVNGHRLVYSPSYESALFFATQAPYAFTADVDAFSGFGLGLPGLQLQVLVSSAPVFGKSLPAPTIRTIQGNYIDFFDAANQTPVEELTFRVKSAGK